MKYLEVETKQAADLYIVPLRSLSDMRVQHSAGIAYYSAAHTCHVCSLNSDLCMMLHYWIITPAVQWETVRIVMVKKGGSL